MDEIKTTVVGGELPYMIEFDGAYGVAESPAGAVMAMLSVKGKIPAGMRDRKAAAAHLLWHYEPSALWLRFIQMLVRDSFDEEALT